jgi:2-keto-myo-inositol isomerase
MISLDRFALNRSVCPRLNIAGFFELASSLGIRKVELRNDLPDEILGGYSQNEISSLAKRNKIQIITINALQNFNLEACLPMLQLELESMLKIAASIECEAIILCPSHSQVDDRRNDIVFKETVETLKAFTPQFMRSGVLGYIEPIGLKDCSLRSLLEAMRAIQESGGNCYKIVYDTFHHFTGPDTVESIKKEYDILYTGLVHASGVAQRPHSGRYTDELRGMLGEEDAISNVEQIALLESLGYRGNISFEPFSAEVHRLDLGSIEKMIRQSVDILQRVGYTRT